MTKIGSGQAPKWIRDTIDKQLDVFEAGAEFSERNALPDAQDIPINLTKDGKSYWFKLKEVICVYIDMQNSTGLTAVKPDRVVARAYQLFTETAVRLLHDFDAGYIDVRGDGAFGLFEGNQPHRALAAAVTFKTFSQLDFVPNIEAEFSVKVGCHLGIDSRSVLVRRLGLRSRGKQTDRQNEVWAGRPVNMAAKLASLSQDAQLLVSDRYFKKLKDEKATHCCSCSEKASLWTEVDLSSDSRFDFDKAHVLKSRWCETHGGTYCEALLKADSE